MCVVVGEGRPFSVKIEDNEIVDALKDKIKEKIEYDGRADRLELCRVNGLTQNLQRQILFNGTPVDMAAKLLNDFDGSTTEMAEAFPLSSYF